MASYLDVLEHPGLSLWFIPAAFLLALYPNVVRVSALSFEWSRADGSAGGGDWDRWWNGILIYSQFLLFRRTIGFDL